MVKFLFMLEGSSTFPSIMTTMDVKVTKQSYVSESSRARSPLRLRLRQERPQHRATAHLSAQQTRCMSKQSLPPPRALQAIAMRNAQATAAGSGAWLAAAPLTALVTAVATNAMARNVLPRAMARSVATAAVADSAQTDALEASVGSSAIAIIVLAIVAVVSVLPAAATTNVGNIVRGTGVHMGAPDLGVRRAAWVMSAAMGAAAKTVQLVVLALTALGTALAQIAMTMPKTSVSPHRQPRD